VEGQAEGTRYFQGGNVTQTPSYRIHRRVQKQIQQGRARINEAPPRRIPDKEKFFVVGPIEMAGPPRLNHNLDIAVRTAAKIVPAGTGALGVGWQGQSPDGRHDGKNARGSGGKETAGPRSAAVQVGRSGYAHCVKD
jgi:hypothetical protein